MSKPERVTSVRNRLSRAMTVPEPEFVPPSFGIAFTKKAPVLRQTNVVSPLTSTAPSSTPPPQPTPQAYGPAQLVNPEASKVVSRFSAEALSSPASQRSQTTMKQARPGSVFISRRSPIDRGMTESFPCYKSAEDTDTASSTSVMFSSDAAKRTASATSRVRFASPAPPDMQHSNENQSDANRSSTLTRCKPSAQNGFSRQRRAATPAATIADPESIFSGPVAPVLQQQPQPPLVYPTANFQQALPHPNQPAFAVIAQDPSALQALLSGDLGGRTFIIQPLHQPYMLPQFQPAPMQTMSSFISSQQPIHQPAYSQQIYSQQQVPAIMQQQSITEVQSWQTQAVTAQSQTATALEAPMPSITLREATPQSNTGPLTIATDSHPLPQTAPCARSPPRSVQSILKSSNQQLYQLHEARKTPLREPQKLTTPAFLKPQEASSQPPPQQTQLTQTREAPPNQPRSSPLCEYVEKLRLEPARTNRRTLAKGAMKSKSMPESENLGVVSMAMGDSSVMSVIDRARLWQQKRQLEERKLSRGGFVDQDLIACGEELVPVEERVRAFNTGQVIEENEAAKRKFNKEFEEERNRRIREQSFSVEVKPRIVVKSTSRPQSQRKPIASPPAGQSSQGDTLSKLSVKEKSNLFMRRSGGGRTMKLDRSNLQRRKTQPVTLDDIARVNQCILQGIDIPPESPIEGYREEDLEMGSCLSSPAASVISDFSETAYAQNNPSKPRGVRIF